MPLPQEQRVAAYQGAQNSLVVGQRHSLQFWFNLLVWLGVLGERALELYDLARCSCKMSQPGSGELPTHSARIESSSSFLGVFLFLSQLQLCLHPPLSLLTPPPLPPPHTLMVQDSFSFFCRSEVSRWDFVLSCSGSCFSCSGLHHTGGLFAVSHSPKIVLLLCGDIHGKI